VLAAPASADVPRSLKPYVLARAADADGRSELAARHYAEALAAVPDNPVVAIRAYREGLSAGDMALVRRARQTLEAAGIAPADAAILAIADALKGGDLLAADAAGARLSGGPLEFLRPIVGAWLALQRGDAGALAKLDAAESPLARRYLGEQRVLMLAALGRGGEAEVGIKALGVAADTRDVRIAAARIGTDRSVAARAGVAALFTQLAADLTDADVRPLVLVLGRAALLLDEGSDRARLVLADTLTADGNNARALAVLGTRRQGPYAEALGAASVRALAREGENRRALEEARRLAEADDADAGSLQRYGDLLVQEGRFDDAAKAYGEAIAKAAAPDWILHVQRGTALEQAERWDEAKRELERAVALAPDEPLALNALSYAQAERGENLAGARARLERAAKLRPDDASIADSLGWAYVQSGMAAKGLPLIERAARAAPGDLEINEHLGDVYWRSGRRYEARYAWAAAAVSADGGDATRLRTKLATGLP
jgi:Flp pilus assembly protein TadD